MKKASSNARGAPAPMHPAADGPIAITSQGSRSFGGRVVRNEALESVHVDHGYVEWQIPANPRGLPILMWHSSSTRTWEATFSGEEGFKTVFLRRGFPVYVIDPPQVGRAGWSGTPYSYELEYGYDQRIFNGFRIGIWTPPKPPEFHPGVQFPVSSPEALDQLFRSAYPEFNIPENVQIQSDGVAKLLDEIGGMTLITHSGSGLRGWWTAMKTDNVRGIVSYEPASFVLPEGEVPPPILRADGRHIAAYNDLLGSAVPVAEFKKLTRFPIQIVCGDNIPTEMDPKNVGPRLTLDNRRVRVRLANIFAEAVNRHGGDAEVLMLPQRGLNGNTHFPMCDLNHLAVADLLSEFLKTKGLDKR